MQHGKIIKQYAHTIVKYTETYFTPTYRPNERFIAF